MGGKQAKHEDQITLERLFEADKLRIEGTLTLMLHVWTKDTLCKFTWVARQGICRLCHFSGDAMCTLTMDHAARMKVALWGLQLWQLPCDMRYEVAQFAYCVTKGYTWDISEV